MPLKSWFVCMGALLLAAAAQSAGAQTAAPAQEHFRKGFDLLRAGNTDEAIARFKAGLSEKPDDPLANLYIGDAYVKRGDTRMALDHYRTALRSGLSDQEASRVRRALAVQYMRQSTTRTRPSISSKDQMNQVSGLARAALLYARAGDQAESRAMFARALKMADSVAGAYLQEAYTSVAWRLAAAGYKQEALDAAAKIQNPSGRAGAVAQIATALERRGASGEARALIGQALQQVNADQSTVLRVNGLRYIAEALWRMGDKSGAQQVLQVMRDAVDANTGRAATSDEARSNMLAAFGDERLAAFDRYTYASMEYAIALFRAGQPSEGKAAASKVRGDARFLLARRLAEAGYPEEAETALQGGHASSDDSWAAEAAEALSEAYAAKGKFADAWKIAAETRNNSAKAASFREIARIQAAAGDMEGAAQTLEARSGRSEQLFRSISAPVARATALARQGDVEAALKLVPEPRTIDYSLAVAYAALKLKEE